MYRADDPRPTHVCIACYRTVGYGPGVCGHCGSPLLSLEEPDVITELRKHAGRKKQSIARRQGLFLVGTAGAGALGIFVTLLATGVYDMPKHAQSTSLGSDFWLLLVLFGALIIPLAYAVRRLRLFEPKGWVDGFDPDTAELPALLLTCRPDGA